MNRLQTPIRWFGITQIKWIKLFQIWGKFWLKCGVWFRTSVCLWQKRRNTVLMGNWDWIDKHDTKELLIMETESSKLDCNADLPYFKQWRLYVVISTQKVLADPFRTFVWPVLGKWNPWRPNKKFFFSFLFGRTFPKQTNGHGKKYVFPVYLSFSFRSKRYLKVTLVDESIGGRGAGVGGVKCDCVF